MVLSWTLTYLVCCAIYLLKTALWVNPGEVVSLEEFVEPLIECVTEMSLDSLEGISAEDKMELEVVMQEADEDDSSVTVEIEDDSEEPVVEEALTLQSVREHMLKVMVFVHENVESGIPTTKL